VVPDKGDSTGTKHHLLIVRSFKRDYDFFGEKGGVKKSRVGVLNGGSAVERVGRKLKFGTGEYRVSQNGDNSCSFIFMSRYYRRV
jgi:hypothetical protein